MARIDAAKLWSLNYRLFGELLAEVAPHIGVLGLEAKELFVLAEVEEHPYPAALAEALCMPKPTVTLYLKRLVSAGLVRREIDQNDLRRHRLELTPAGRKVSAKGLALLSAAFVSRLSRLNAAEQMQFAALLGRLA
jgi:DNA-binding MarR family transcriptional regulator